MRKILSVFVVLMILPLSRASAAPTPESFADTVDQLIPAVVNISTTQKVKGGGVTIPEFQFPDMPNGSPFGEFRDFFEQFKKQPNENGEQDAPERKMYSLGSGFVIDPKGYIVTNNHVIADADEVTVKFSDNSQYKAKIIGKDKSTDLAVLKIDAGKDLPFVKFGDSEKSRVGDWVIAIGNPFGLGGTVTVGIISARSRDIYAGPFDDFIQTDAAINRGNSGGPMFNAQGEVIGINTAIFSPSGGNIGIGFAVPATLAEPVISQLKQFGKAKRGWLGVKIQTVSPEIAESLGMKDTAGALVVDVTKDSPADKAGIKSGDLITKFDGKNIAEMRKLPKLVAETEIGKKVDVEVIRQGESKLLKLTTGELKDSDNTEKSPAVAKKEDKFKGGKEVMGMTVSSIVPELVEKLGVESNLKGVVVVGISEKSPAAERGVRVFDVITRVNELEVSTPEQFAERIQSAKKSGRKNALLRVQRGNDILFITVPVQSD